MSSRILAAGAAGLLVFLALAVWLRDGAEERPPAASPEPEQAVGRAERTMAGPGYLPDEAPLKAPPAPPPRKGATSVDFDLLSYFDYDPEVDSIPDEVVTLDGKLVELRAVMYYAVENPDHVTDFYAMPNHMVCCFGIPRTNEIVEVVLRPGTATQYVLNYYLIRGRLAVGAVRDDQDRVLCLYRITDAEVEMME